MAIRQVQAAPSTWSKTTRALGPGLLLSVGAAALSYGLSLVLPGVSALIIAITLGIALANTFGAPPAASAGIDLAAKKLLRAGIVLLGLQLALDDIVQLGWAMLVVVVGIVVLGLTGTLVLGRLLKVRSGLTLLIGCGFSICGAAAVAAAAGVTDPDGQAEEDTVTAVTLVVLFGTAMILVVPLAAPVLGLNGEAAGMWAGGSIHEVAQVVAVGSVLGSSALAVAVVVKLARVLLLAPVMAVLSLRQRRRLHAHAGNDTQDARLPPVVPLFVVGFIATVLLRSFVPLPEAVLAGASVLQTALLAAAMFALGCGVKIRRLVQVGLRPFVLAACSTVLVAATACIGILVVG